MNILQIDDVELLSIKTKSLEDLDNETNLNARNTFCEKGSTAKACDDDVVKEENDDDDHYKSSVRYVAINKSPNGACGFHLTRTKWDPYPWVNGCDVLGLRITEIAKLVKSSQHQVTLLLWSSNCNSACDEESLCAAPMPRSLQRLSLVVQTVLSLIECPVCLDTITPPAMQCQNGHLLCVNCRIRAEKCPVCRDRYFPRPALIAEQIQSAITSAFNLCRNEDKVRQKIFGRHNRQRQMVKATLDCLVNKQQQQQQQQHKLNQHSEVHKFLTANTQTEEIRKATTFSTTVTTNIEKTITNSKCDGKVVNKFVKCGSNSSSSRRTCNKFLTKLLNSKAYSMENLTNGHNNNVSTIDATATAAATTDNTFNTCHTTITSAVSQHEPHHSSYKQLTEHKTLFKDFTPKKQQQQQQQTSSVTNTNQFNDLPRNVARNHQHLLTYKPNLNSIENDLNINKKLCCCIQMSNNKLKQFPLTWDKDLTRCKEGITCILESPNNIFMNDTNKICYRSPIVCETSHATIPRAIKLKETHYKQRRPTQECQNDERTKYAGRDETAVNCHKLNSSSMTSLNFSFDLYSS